VLEKIEYSHKIGKPIDGHAPGLKAHDLKKYISAGITTDHECFTLNEALEKIKLGMNILIREGSAAKNFESLHPLIKKHPKQSMFCTDDCHPDDLLNGHINRLVLKSLNLGYDIFDILQVASVNPVEHYKLNVGLLQIGDPADFIIVDNLSEFNVLQTIINGRNVLEKNKKILKNKKQPNPKYWFPQKFNENALTVKKETSTVNVIEIVPGELITKKMEYVLKSTGKFVKSSTKEDIIKLVIVNRFKEKEIFTAFINGTGIKKGAIASSIAHDSHHILAIGVDDRDIRCAINYIIKNRGGISCSLKNEVFGLKLPVYGIISDSKTEIVAKKYKQLLSKAKEIGVKIESPFMTLSFMALTVIPDLKISPKGLFDVKTFSYTSLFIK
jgi:adenine deaminase